MSIPSVLIRLFRTLTSGPPESLEFGELAFSDADNGLHIGKADGSTHTFQAGIGPQGEPGAQGEPGEAGPQGEPGPQGPPGATTIEGIDGLQTALNNRSYLQNISGFNRGTHNGQSGEWFSWNTDGRVKDAMWNNTGAIEFRVDATLLAITPTSSDIRLKQNIVYLDEIPGLQPNQRCLEAVSQVRLCEFDWRPESIYGGGHVPVGVIAQDLQAIAPQLVSELSDGTLQINVMGAIPYLVGAIQELEKRIKVLEAD